MAKTMTRYLDRQQTRWSNKDFKEQCKAQNANTYFCYIYANKTMLLSRKYYETPGYLFSKHALLMSAVFQKTF